MAAATSNPNQIRLLRRPSAGPRPQLSPAQLEIVAARKERLLVLAGPGTGKSTTLVAAAIARIAAGDKPDSLLILTYGREQASLLRDQIVQGAASSSFEPIARTFHSLAFSIINDRQDMDAPRYVLVSGAEQDSFIRELLATEELSQSLTWHSDLKLALTTKGFAKELRDLILRATERNYSPQDLADKGRELNEPYWVGVAHFWNEYERILALRYGTVSDTALRIDPSAVITKAIELLRIDPELRKRYQNRFSAIMIDEFQESDAAQRELLHLLAGDDLIIFADPDSAVGSFRGADPEGAIDFALAISTRTILLPTVHRSTVAITELGLAVANHFRGNSLTRSRSAGNYLGVDRGISTARSENTSEAAHYIAQTFRSAHLREGLPWSEMAVIVRSPGVQVSALVRAFSIVGIPVAVSSDALALAENPAIKPFLQILEIVLGRVKLEIRNWPVIEELLFSQLCGADAISLRQLRLQLVRHRSPGDSRTVTEMMLGVLTEPIPDLPEGYGEALLKLRALIEAGRKAHKSTPVFGDLLWALWSTATDYDGKKIADSWRDQALAGGARGASADHNLDSMMELFEAARRFSERLPQSSPAAFLDQLLGEKILGDTITAKGVREDIVEILTVHSAKGRQWDLVALAGLQEGTWPNLRQRGSLLGSERLVEAARSGLTVRDQISAASANALVEDERRLLHVAVTRARSGVLISAWQEEDSEPSQYFEELDEFIRGDAPLDESFATVTRSLTSTALVAELRRELQSNSVDAPFAASLLKTLGERGVASARPSNWLGVAAITSTEPVVAPSASIWVSPSNLQSFSECGVKWFLEKSGGRDGDSTAQLLGSAIHALAAQLASEPALAITLLSERLKNAWALIAESTGWVGDQEFRSAAEKLQKFYSWHHEISKSRTLLGAEKEFEVHLGRVILRGSVDRIELTADGQIFIADLKTGAPDVSKSEALEHRQLSGYQLAVLEGGFTYLHPSSESAGAELVYLGGTTKSASIRSQATPDHEQLKTEVIAAAEGMSGANFAAVINKRCRNCGVKASCPIQSHGKSVIEP